MGTSNPGGARIMGKLRDQVQVNIPFTMLYEFFLDGFLTKRLNPEIGFDASALDRYGPSDFSHVAKKLREGNLTVTLHAPFMDLSPGSPDPRVRSLTRERLGQILGPVRAFLPKTVVCHTGYDGRRYGHMWGDWMEKSLELWSWLAPQIRREGSLLVLENVYEQGPEEMLPLFEELAAYGVGFCLDTGHQAAFGRSPLEKWVDFLGPYLGELHLHDNSGKQDEHLALGNGSIDFSRLFRKLGRTSKRPLVVTLEPHREEDVFPSLEYLEKIWPW